MSIYKPKGSPYFHYDFRWQGRRIYGSSGQTSKTAARKVEAVKRRELAEGDTLRQVTLDEAAGIYWTDKAMRQASAKTTEYQTANLIAGLGKDVPLGELKASAIATYAARRRAKVSDSSVNREIEILRRVINYATARLDAAVPRINWRTLKYREPQERVRELSGDEEARLFAALRPDLHDFVRFALFAAPARPASLA